MSEKRFQPAAQGIFDTGSRQHRLTPLQGEIVWSEKTGVWGEKGEVYADRISNPLRFQGQYFDAETGLHYNRYRYYDPEIAGFISQDPIGLAGGLNVYQYAPNPLGWVDPWGLSVVLLNIIISRSQIKLPTFENSNPRLEPSIEF